MIFLLALGFILLSCAPKIQEPYCYPDRVLESLYTFREAEEACPREDPLIREACLGKYINTKPRVREAKELIKELKDESVDITRRIEIHRRLSGLIDYFNCKFFEDCPSKHRLLIRDCYKAKPKPLPSSH